MIIAFQTDVSSSVESLHSDFNFLIFSAMAALYPDLNFLMLTQNEIDPCFITEKNIRIIFTKPKPTGFLKKLIRFENAIPELLKKHKARFFFNNNYWCDKIPDCKNIINIDNKVVFENKKSLKHLSNADFVMVMNDYLKSMTEKYCPSKKNKIIVVPGVLNKNIVPLNDTQRDEVKKEFSDEKDYFLLYAENSFHEQIIDCLKAFSQFKKWQKSSMKILIVVNDKHKTAVDDAVSSYKFREDVIIVSNKPAGTINALIASSYCMICLDTNRQSRQKIFFAMQSEVPVILPDGPSEHSSFKNAALFGTENEKVLSKNMMLIYKDEETRSALIKSGINLTMQLHDEKIAGIIKHGIIDATQT